MGRVMPGWLTAYGDELKFIGAVGTIMSAFKLVLLPYLAAWFFPVPDGPAIRATQLMLGVSEPGYTATLAFPVEVLRPCEIVRATMVLTDVDGIRAFPRTDLAGLAPPIGKHTLRGGWEVPAQTKPGPARSVAMNIYAGNCLDGGPDPEAPVVIRTFAPVVVPSPNRD